MKDIREDRFNNKDDSDKYINPWKRFILVTAVSILPIVVYYLLPVSIGIVLKTNILIILVVSALIITIYLRTKTYSLKLPQSTWSPFQSPEVREICANLTPDEHARLIANACQRGREIGWWIAVPFGIAVASLLYSRQLGFVLMTLFAIYFVVSGWPRMRAMRRRTMEFLCETEWARSRGYTPEHLGR
jgi:hypothetical protein